MARPKKEVNKDLLIKLAKLHLSDKAIAHVLNVSVHTLNRRYAQLIDKCKSESICKMAEVLFDEGINKRQSWALKLMLSKHLGYSDKIQFDNQSDGDKPFVLSYNLSQVKKVADGT